MRPRETDRLHMALHIGAVKVKLRLLADGTSVSSVVNGLTEGAFVERGKKLVHRVNIE